MPNSFNDDNSPPNAIAKIYFCFHYKEAVVSQKAFPDKISPFLEKRYHEAQKINSKTHRGLKSMPFNHYF